MEYILTDISSIYDGRVAYIYVWFSKKGRCLYVGQTFGSQGVLGRAFAHTSLDGTLRKRFYDTFGQKMESVNDWKLLSFILPRTSKYNSSASSYRLAVEYLVQKKLHGVRGDFSVPCRIISNVSYVEYCEYKENIKIANNILKVICKAYNE